MKIYECNPEQGPLDFITSIQFKAELDQAEHGLFRSAYMNGEMIQFSNASWLVTSLNEEETNMTKSIDVTCESVGEVKWFYAGSTPRRLK